MENRINEYVQQITILREKLEFTIKLLGRWKKRIESIQLDLNNDLEQLKKADDLLSKECTPELFNEE